jgi:hypothetical protein
MLIEVAGSSMFFQSISRVGQVVDSGVIQRQPKAADSVAMGTAGSR